jgi:hypothetical protein
MTECECANMARFYYTKDRKFETVLPNRDAYGKVLYD